MKQPTKSPINKDHQDTQKLKHAVVGVQQLLHRYERKIMALEERIRNLEGAVRNLEAAARSINK